MEDGNFYQIVDSRLPREYNHSEMAKMVSRAVVCVRHSTRTTWHNSPHAKMSQVIRALEGDISQYDLAECIKPGHNSAYNDRSHAR